MNRKLFFVMSLVCLLGLFSTASAIDWDAGSPDSNDWDDTLNWNPDGLPVAGEQAYVSAGSSPPINPVIKAGMTIPATGVLSHIVVGGLGSAGTPTLNIDGGDIYTNWFNMSWGTSNSVTAEVYMTGGNLNVVAVGGTPGHIALGIPVSGASGSCLFVQSSGVVDCNVAIVDWDASNENSSTAQLDLEGDATFTVKDYLHLWPDGAINIAGTATLTVDIAMGMFDGYINIEEDGTLKIAGDVTADLAGDWSDNIVAYEGVRELSIVVGGGYTTIKACPLSDLSGDCDVDEEDLFMMLENWLE